MSSDQRCTHSRISVDRHSPVVWHGTHRARNARCLDCGMKLIAMHGGKPEDREFRQTERNGDVFVRRKVRRYE